MNVAAGGTSRKTVETLATNIKQKTLKLQVDTLPKFADTIGQIFSGE
jgi:hypothetical protein